MRAADIMSRPAITVRPDTPLVEIVALMLKKHISAVPVVDADDRLVGIVSEGDLLKRKGETWPSQRSWWLQALGGKAMLAEDFVKAHAARAGDLMTEEVVTVSPDALLPDIAQLLERHRIKRVPVMRDGKVAGIISRSNLLRALALQTASRSAHPSPGDREIRDRILDLLGHEKWADVSHLSLVVQDGVAYLWGEVPTVAQRKALIVAAREVDGVKDVIDHMRVYEIIY